MNSKVLNDKIEDHKVEMRLLKRNEKNTGQMADQEKPNICSSDTTVSLKHYDQLLCDLRCPGCTIRLQSPIYLCASGHSLCRLCHISLTTCPICSKEMTDMRSFTLERLSQKFQFPCKNLRNGCNVRLPMELMKWHEEKCIYKKTSCFMGKVWHDCHWMGREDEWLQHCKEKHAHKILQKQDVYELMWNYETLKDNAGPILTYYLIENFNEMFNLYQIHEAKHATLTWTVMIADYKETALDKTLDYELPKFSFELEFYKKDDPRFALIQRYPVHYEDSDTLLDDGKCARVQIKDIKRFLDGEKNLFYKLRIVSCKLKKDLWDQVLEKAKHKIRGDSKDSNFAFLNSIDDASFIDDDRYGNAGQIPRNDDLLRQIFQREFPEPTESSSLIQKPPRKSLENTKKDQRNSVKFRE